MTYMSSAEKQAADELLCPLPHRAAFGLNHRGVCSSINAPTDFSLFLQQTRLHCRLYYVCTRRVVFKTGRTLDRNSRRVVPDDNVRRRRPQRNVRHRTRRRSRRISMIVRSGRRNTRGVDETDGGSISTSAACSFVIIAALTGET